ncbi:RNA polymerase sigma factor SigJ [Rubellicoccus peritrichatus]|uniref:RNA polymerase sigma factor SigJ n=1 Tax=Rubellicoccus peritrichatus TaxID=3080537 RepID=A0AAQ3LC89_9BACT|nr:RNA polymerase sigma factor SigJ [Puniceicoccus sp. CR14]WOO41767.1 RNA polymerase sigma factor SigJ [Puniceicoccus sp. CR14]
MHPEETQIFESYRSLLEAIAYRMVGSLSEAEDVVQNTYIKWAKVEKEAIRSPKSWLVTTCSRTAMDVLKSAKVRRLEYVGPWLPEPFIETKSNTPDEKAEIDDTVSMALMLALEKLTAAERAALLLHDVFDYSFDEVGEILKRSSVACRNLASRARKKAQTNRTKFKVSPHEHEKLLSTFLDAAQSGDINSLKSILVESVELHSDGGGKVTAARKVVIGNEVVSKFFANIYARPKTGQTQAVIKHYWYNGAPGIVGFENNKPVVAFSIEIDPESGKIEKLFALRNPDKLKYFCNDALIAEKSQ